MKLSRKNTLSEKVMKNVQNLGDKKIIVACSGWPDSMVMLDIFSKGKASLVVAHVDHGLRKSADRDEQIVREYCEKNKLKIEVLHVDAKKEAKKTKTTLEECARNIRKVWLEKIRKKHKADLIMTAHHADDQAETILYRITKGTSITGLVGIEENIQYYFRPMIHSTKSEILEYAKKNKLIFGHDETNDDISIPRNLLRHKVIPKLQKINPKLSTALGRLSQSAHELKIGFDEFFSEVLKWWSFELDWFHGLPLGFQHELLRFIYEKTNGSTHGLSTALIEELDRFLSTRNGGKKEIKKLKLEKKQGKVYFNEA